MHLTPREHERLLLAAAADLARRRLARGARLGSTEAIALICDEACEMAWDGVPLADVIEQARRLIPPDALLPGAAALVPVIEVEALFPWGTSLIHIDHPFAPAEERSSCPRLSHPVPPEPIRLAASGRRRVVRLRNGGERDVWISSHFPLSRVNPAVEVTGLDGDGRLDLPAGEALLLPAGQEREATVVMTP